MTRAFLHRMSAEMAALGPAALLVYVAGVLAGIVAGGGRPAVRVGLALAWPLGPLAFVTTVAMLLAAAAIAFPMFGLLLAAAGAIGWWASS